jgi:hypothetical protein
VVRNGLGYFYTAAGYGRFMWYPGTGDPPAHYTPTLWVDGIDDKTSGGTVSSLWSIYTGMISARQPVPTPLEMSLQVVYGARGDTGTVHVQMAATDTIPYSSLRIRTCIVEDGLSYGGRIHDQILRNYFAPTSPYHAGTPISISEGDTLVHTDDFIMDPAWVVENCRIVAFVQNGVGVPAPEIERELVQAVQAPLLTAAPDEVADLTITLVEDDLRLDWSPVLQDIIGNPLTVDLYHVYRDTVGFFGPGSDPFDSTVSLFYVDSSGATGDTLLNYYYAVTAVAGTQESDFSGAVGEFDKHLDFESPESR